MRLLLTYKLFFMAFLLVCSASAQNNLEFKGQAIGYTHFNPSNDQSLWFGARYLPQINSEFKLKNINLIDFEASANIYGNAAIDLSNSTEYSGDLKPYRLWARFSNEQLEIRAGLQKINFGSASMLRPLMWFDQIDPRDPLKLTDGVWGVLGRYYFLNNSNIWLWGLYGNENPKGWESFATAGGKPEFGGRIQYPVPLGEAAFSYNHRIASVNPNMAASAIQLIDVPENRYGFDLRLDWTLGTWIEASWVNKSEDVGMFTNQEIFNLGFDYTFGIGSGLYVAYEQLLVAYDQQAFSFGNPISFSLLSMAYPVGLFDNLSAIVYYDWSSNNAYNFVNYQHQFENISLYVMAYWNPKDYNIPTQGGSTNLFGGKGIQLMIVWNH